MVIIVELCCATMTFILVGLYSLVKFCFIIVSALLLLGEIKMYIIIIDLTITLLDANIGADLQSVRGRTCSKHFLYCTLKHRDVHETSKSETETFKKRLKAVSLVLSMC